LILKIKKGKIMEKLVKEDYLNTISSKKILNNYSKNELKIDFCYYEY